MNIRLKGEPDRIVEDLYVWVVTDKRTKMQGIFSMTLGPLQMQCATSSPDIAKKMGEKIKELPFNGKEFTLYRYKKADVVQTL